MEMPNLLAGSDTLNFMSIVESAINQTCIVDYGIIQNVVADGVVNVAVAVSDTEQNMFCMTCVLANIASSSLTIDVAPNPGDRVLVLYPRIYDEDMFTVPENNDDKKKILVKAKANGYNLCCGIAILVNQYKEASHKNIIQVKDGELSMKLAYSKNDDKNLIDFSMDKDGAVSFSNDKCSFSVDKDGAVSFSNDKSTFDIDKNGYLAYKNTGDNKTTLEFTSSGATIQDGHGCKIEMSSSFTTINGKLKVKNG